MARQTSIHSTWAFEGNSMTTESPAPTDLFRVDHEQQST